MVGLAYGGPLRACDVATLGTFQVFAQKDGVDIVESEESSSSLGCAPSYPEILVHRMESTAGTEHAEGFRGFLLGTGDIQPLFLKCCALVFEAKA